jgi:hypothetical protein
MNVCENLGSYSGEMSIVVCLAMTTCNVVGRYLLHPEDGGDIFIRNFVNSLQDYTVSQLLRLHSTFKCTVLISFLAFNPCEQLRVHKFF